MLKFGLGRERRLRETSYRRRRLGEPFTRKATEIGVAVITAITVYGGTKHFDITSTLDDKQFSEILNQVDPKSDLVGRPLLELVRSVLLPIENYLELIFALIAALILLMLTGYVFRYFNRNQEETLARLYESDPKVIAVINDVLDAMEKFQESSKTDPELHRLLSEYIDQKSDAFVGFLKRISDLDIDVDSSNEQYFTRQLVDVANTKISAISVDEEEFYSNPDEAGPYLERQVLWLSKDEKREITRIFVTPEDGRSNTKFLNMLAKHNEMIQQSPTYGGLLVGDPIQRYKFRVVTWNEWEDIMKDNADLIIYDDKYVRKGPLEQREHRRAQFRANRADVGDAIAKYKALLAVSKDDLDDRVKALKPKKPVPPTSGQ